MATDEIQLPAPVSGDGGAQSPAPDFAPPSNSKAGLVLGIFALFFGLVSIFVWGTVFTAPLAFLLGMIGLFIAVPKRIAGPIVCNALGMTAAIVGLATSPMVWMVIGLKSFSDGFKSSSAVARPAVQKRETYKPLVPAAVPILPSQQKYATPSQWGIIYLTTETDVVILGPLGENYGQSRYSKPRLS